MQVQQVSTSGAGTSVVMRVRCLNFGHRPFGCSGERCSVKEELDDLRDVFRRALFVVTSTYVQAN